MSDMHESHWTLNGHYFAPRNFMPYEIINELQHVGNVDGCACFTSEHMPPVTLELWDLGQLIAVIAGTQKKERLYDGTL